MNQMSEEKTIIKRRKMTVEVIEFANNTMQTSINSEGFSTFEVIGLCESIRVDMLHRIRNLEAEESEEN